VFDFLDADAQEFSAVLCGRNAVQVAPPGPVTLDLPDLAKRLSAIGEVKQNDYLVRFNSGEHEVTVFRDGRAIVKGTDDIAAARGIYARFIGV
jgi:adenylyltransferase/sulfurtransferase